MDHDTIENFHKKQGGVQKVQIGPRIDAALVKRTKNYAINIDVTFEQVVEAALYEYMRGRDTTPVVQLTLPLEFETDYNDPRYEKLKDLLDIARNTTAGPKGKVTMISRINKEYALLMKLVSIDTQLAVEVQAVLEELQEGIPKLLEE